MHKVKIKMLISIVLFILINQTTFAQSALSDSEKRFINDFKDADISEVKSILESLIYESNGHNTHIQELNFSSSGFTIETAYSTKLGEYRNTDYATISFNSESNKITSVTNSCDIPRQRLGETTPYLLISFKNPVPKSIKNTISKFGEQDRISYSNTTIYWMDISFDYIIDLEKNRDEKDYKWKIRECFNAYNALKRYKELTENTYNPNWRSARVQRERDRNNSLVMSRSSQQWFQESKKENSKGALYLLGGSIVTGGGIYLFASYIASDEFYIAIPGGLAVGLGSGFILNSIDHFKIGARYKRYGNKRKNLSSIKISPVINPKNKIFLATLTIGL